MLLAIDIGNTASYPGSCEQDYHQNRYSNYQGPEF